MVLCCAPDHLPNRTVALGDRALEIARRQGVANDHDVAAALKAFLAKVVIDLAKAFLGRNEYDRVGWNRLRLAADLNPQTVDFLLQPKGNIAYAVQAGCRLAMATWPPRVEDASTSVTL